jgi:hypothetical protein
MFVSSSVAAGLSSEREEREREKEREKEREREREREAGSGADPLAPDRREGKWLTTAPPFSNGTQSPGKWDPTPREPRGNSGEWDPDMG